MMGDVGDVPQPENKQCSKESSLLVETTKPKKIGTHDGTFHADEVLACVMLKMTTQFQDADIFRTRDSRELATCDIIVDVGGIYDHDSLKYDHHQREFNETMSTLDSGITSSIKLSSAGLIYFHYGKEVIRSILSDDHELCEQKVNCVWVKVYECLIKEIDAIDNGVNIAQNTMYSINTNLSNRVAMLNPQWNKPVSEIRQFNIAMGVVGAELVTHVKHYANSWWPARTIVKEAMVGREEGVLMDQVIVLERFCPWTSHLFELEESMQEMGKIKFVVFRDRDSWRVRAVPITPESFTLRIPIHPLWQGRRDAALSEVADIEDCVFVHVNGFIGGNHTRAGAIQMAVKSLEYHQATQQE